MTADDLPCGLDVALAVVGGKWKPIILYHLRANPKRFGDLKRLVAGISEKVLIQQLRELAAAGVLVRHDYREVPPKVDYTMTAFGMTLVEALMPLCSWGTEHRARVDKNISVRSALEGRDEDLGASWRTELQPGAIVREPTRGLRGNDRVV